MELGSKRTSDRLHSLMPAGSLSPDNLSTLLHTQLELYRAQEHGW